MHFRSAFCTVALACATLMSAPASATCSAEPYMASICVTAANYCPRGYLDANGQLLAISQNSALFSLLGTTYGGNGQTTFALPNLQSRSVVGIGQGQGLAPIQQGEMAGLEATTLQVSQLPAHSHSAQLNASADAGNTDTPSGAVAAKLARSNIYNSGAATVAMGASAITVGVTGSNAPVPLRNPYLGLRHCIATQGLYPPRD